MRKLFIAADMEGCAGVSAPQALGPDRWQWEWVAARRWMTSDVVTSAEAAFAAGYDEVIVADGHGNAHNIDPEQMPDNCYLVRSWPRPLLHMQGIEDPDIRACVFIGYHAAPEQAGSVLAHVYNGAACRSVRLNGQACSEGFLNAALAGEYGKPIVFVSGDKETIDDARRYAPEAGLFVTKQSIGWRSQMSLSPGQVRQQLRERLSIALAQDLPAPFVVPGPYRLEMVMTSHVAAEMLAYLPGVERTGAFSVAASFERIAVAMRFLAFSILYTPTGIPAL